MKQTKDILEVAFYFLILFVMCAIAMGAYGAEPALGIDKIANLSWKQAILVPIVVFFPGLVAVVLTISVVCLIKHGNRASNKLPVGWKTQVFTTLTTGAVIGPTMQLLFQRLMHWLFGLPKFWELVALAGLLTGIFSIVLYHVLLWYCNRKKWVGAYAILRCKHSSELGHAGDSEDGDLTTANRENDTERR